MHLFTRLFGLRNASPVASGIYWSGIWLAIGAILLSVLLTGSSFKESNLQTWVFGVHGFAALAGGFVSARRSGRRGWYFGLANGLFYAVLLLTISFLATDAGWTSAVPILLLVTCLAGALGGMLGVNTGSSSR
ncbi:TIGR04086 family membrane protein [Cohnella terricola]|uniref:TIGR04086 family membrane protein n=1 Tax=Cohnella terricola TaxID=1289167 RepID=A0A559JW07_9BACL|nr:TIGR04086 family membrane protein [Cohnella terricola]TVY04082.1 TIGR04086 family membrane protein [Cohnella terricola]